MELVHAQGAVIDVEAELLALYPLVVRRLTLVMRTSDDAEDVAQAAFEKAFQARHRFSGHDVRAWFYTIALRLAFNELRRMRRRPRSAVGPEPTWAMSVDPDLWSALGDLPPQHSAALLLSELDGYTHAEIGSLLGVPEGTVSSWLSRTKERLRAELGGNDD